MNYNHFCEFYVHWYQWYGNQILTKSGSGLDHRNDDEIEQIADITNHTMRNNNSCYLHSKRKTCCLLVWITRIVSFAITTRVSSITKGCIYIHANDYVLFLISLNCFLMTSVEWDASLLSLKTICWLEL